MVCSSASTTSPTQEQPFSILIQRTIKALMLRSPAEMVKGRIREIQRVIYYYLHTWPARADCSILLFSSALVKKEEEDNHP